MRGEAFSRYRTSNSVAVKRPRNSTRIRARIRPPKRVSNMPSKPSKKSLRDAHAISSTKLSQAKRIFPLYLFDATADLLDHGTGDTGGLVVIAQHPPHAWDPLYGGQANLSPLSFPSSARTTGSNPKAVNELLWVFTILHPSSILPSISLPCQPLLVRNVLGFVEIRLRPIYESKSEIMIDFPASQNKRF